VIKIIETKYNDLLKGKFETLGYFADKYFDANSRYERFQILAEDIWPLMQTECLKPIHIQLANEAYAKKNTLK